MSSCIFPGSFDPFTKGHENVVLRSLEMFDTVYIAVLNNSEKKCVFTAKERVAFIEECFKGNDNVKVILYGGLLVELCKRLSVNTVVRGLRGATDYEYEEGLFNVNHALYEKFETVFFQTTTDLLHVSSTYVREILSYGGDISAFVPKSIAELVVKTYISNNK